MNDPKPDHRWHFADFAAIDGVECPCGVARRAFAGVGDFPGTLHVTQISEDAKRHYHKRLTETYFIMDCEAGAAMELDDKIIPVRAHQSFVIPPGVRHRAIGRMTVLIICVPEFDPDDEWLE